MALSITTLSPDEITRFLMRHRRGETLERYEPRLDHFLREILAKANEFVPSESGAILLDDPRAKFFGSASNQLTLIATFGEWAHAMIGQKMTCDRGMLGQVYSAGRSTRCLVEEEQDRHYYAELDARTGLYTRSLLGVPVLLGNSICGVLQLVNRLGRDSYTDEDLTLIEIFAGYISSSIQNTLDGMRAKELARRDDLTGLFNDRYFHFRLREEISRAEAAGTNLALIFLDLDRFKEINDSYGHLEGSRTLHELGILLENEIPPEAVVARYGGDEFVVILPGTDVMRASEVAHHLLQRISSSTFLAESFDGSKEVRKAISASLGVAALHEHVPDVGNSVQRANTLIRKADAAMYRAKAEGRNRVIMAGFKTKEYPIASSSSREPSDASDCGAAQSGGRSDPRAPSDMPGATDSLCKRPGHGRSG